MLAGQIIVQFLPSGGYEKYVKMMISIMVLSQIALPILSLGNSMRSKIFKPHCGSMKRRWNESPDRWKRRGFKAVIIRRRRFP